jgi:hypothetical protein
VPSAPQGTVRQSARKELVGGMPTERRDHGVS